MVDKFLAEMSVIDANITDGKASLTDVCVACSKYTKLTPYTWINFVHNWIENLNPKKLWEKATGVPDYRSLKYTKRFFPMQNQGATAEDRQNWESITNKVMVDQYPDFDSEKESKDGTSKKRTLRHSNFIEVTEQSNYTVLSPWDGKNPVNEKEIELVVSAMEDCKQYDYVVKLLYYLSHNARSCHLAYKSKLVSDLTAKYVQMPKYRDLLIAGLWYGSVIMAHEEELMREGYSQWDENHRSVFRLSELKLPWYPYVSKDIETNPLITVNGSIVPLANRIMLHLSGERSIVDVKLFEQRIDHITKGAMRGFEAYENVILCGSTITDCAASLVITDLLSDPAKEWEERSNLYYAGGDIDIAIRSVSYKQFMSQAAVLIKLIGTNLGSPAKYKLKTSQSGVRLQVKHAKLDRHFEIFRTPLEFIKLVGGFHVPCVKAYWDFKRRDLIMTRSFVTAINTGVMETFDWFSTLKNPIDIILKNTQRGFATVLNDKEMACVHIYMNQPGAWCYPRLTKYDKMGSHSRLHNFFRIDKYPAGLRYGLPVIKTDKVDNYGEIILNESWNSNAREVHHLHHKGEAITRKKTGTGNTELLIMPPVV